MTTTIRLRGPADIITVLPYHLGYRPTHSLVLVCLVGTRLTMVGRVDLPPPSVDPLLLVGELLPLVRRERPDRVMLVAFEDAEGDAEAASAAMRDALEDEGIPVSDRLVVREGRWWSLDCDGDCCPPEGEPVPGEEQIPAVSDYILLGRRPASTRESLAERLTHRTDPDQDARCAILMRDLVAARRSRSTLARRRRRMLQEWSRILPAPAGDGPRDPPPADDEAWAWAVVSLLDVEVRDLLIAWLCPGALDLDAFPLTLRRLAETELPRRDLGLASDHSHDDGADADDEPGPADGDDLVERLAMVCRAAPPELSPGPLTVLAHVVWWLGDGALSRTALDRALAVEPGYRLAVLLLQMVDAAARPRRSA